MARTKEKTWSEREITYFETNLHRLSVAVLARKPGRSVTGVALKTKRLGIKKSGEGYTVRSLAQAFGIDDHKIVRWVELGVLKTSRWIHFTASQSNATMQYTRVNYPRMLRNEGETNGAINEL